MKCDGDCGKDFDRVMLGRFEGQLLCYDCYLKKYGHHRSVLNIDQLIKKQVALEKKVME